MLSINVIERLSRGGHWGQLANALAGNGLELPLSLRIRLQDSPAAAVALALRRVVELTYGSTALSRGLTADLLRHQSPDGSFDGDPLPTAAAIAALGLLIHDQPRAADDTTRDAHSRALAALAAMQQDDGLFAAHVRTTDRTVQERALTTAFAFSLLIRHDEFRAAVRLGDAADWFDAHSHTLDDETRHLWTLARSDAPAHVATPALAAIAA